MKLLFILFALFCSAAQSQELANKSPYPKLLGHNLSMTSYVLKKGECTFGFVFTGCGINDKSSLGFSPWLVHDYKMMSVGWRQQLRTKKRTASAIQAIYFKTYEDRENSDNSYKMEALWLTGVHSKIYTRTFAAHYNFALNYYFDETMPFSLRRPYRDPVPAQANASILLESKLYKTWFMLGELGLLDMLNDPLHTHAGLSVGHKWKKGYIYFGFTYTSTFHAMFEPTKRSDYQQELAESRGPAYEGDLSPSKVKYDYSIHPEMSFQYFF